jgi:BirA family biotin operon repressor/biotin-[acetyl-CoA-carboxylase] ligase
MPDDYLDADELRASTFVQHVEIHKTLGSTNDRAAELARDPQIELPALIAARNQIAGRGRGNNTWWSNDGALTFSVLLEPARFGIVTSNWPQLSLATAVAICDSLTLELHPKSASLTIKWPNDVMLNDAKVCGILIESPGGTARAKDCLIIGIGININNAWQNVPRDLLSRGTSLCEATGRLHPLQTVIVQILNALKSRLDELSVGNIQLSQTWQRLCWLSQKRVCIRVGQNTIDGICSGIATDGALLVDTPAKTERVYSGVLELRE